MTLKQRIRNYSLKKLGKNAGANAAYPGFISVKRFAIVFEKGAADKDVLDFAKKLKAEGKDVELLAYIPRKRKEITEQQTYKYFCKDDVNWYGKPSAEVLSTFIKQDFDVLISLNDKDQSPIQFLTIAGKANFTIGLKSSTLKVLDLQVARPDGDDFSPVFKEVDFYLRFINK
ncbi:DUF6913 domain-containing protein [Owenweeksia hongkongensis]|uniref:DUF6913 domain-containing protein n=1 Tax=Owenweeksia hongkongensis TaxID=253245 RepID=UPI003A8F39B4